MFEEHCSLCEELVMKKNMGYVEEHYRLCEELGMKKNMGYVEEHCSNVNQY